VRATTTCLIMADHNRYSVDARAAGRMVLVRSHAEHIVVLFNDEVVADHTRGEVEYRLRSHTARAARRSLMMKSRSRRSTVPGG
jgi:hypothetical protein